MTWEGLSPPYKAITIDPPWPYRQIDRTKAEAAGHYSAMSLEDLRALPVADLADPSGTVLFLWTTNRFCGAAYQLAEAWGFEPVTMLTWGKLGQPGVGRWLRSRTEHCVIAKMGKPALPEVPPDSLQMWGREHTGRYAHSVKPAAAYDLVETMSTGPYLDLFGRRQRLGWSSWGWGYEGQVSA
jgi:N6-adenosine-specific RNA methylase IME4